MTRSSEWSLPLKFSDQNYLLISHLPHGCHMPRSSDPPWFHHQTNIWWSLQVMKPLIMQSSPVSRNLLPLRSKHSQHPFLKHLQTLFFPQCDRQSFTPIKATISIPISIERSKHNRLLVDYHPQPIWRLVLPLCLTYTSLIRLLLFTVTLPIEVS
jgi:hypothetical protein